MLYFPTDTLAAIERDRLRTAAHGRLLARIRRELRRELRREQREQAAPVPERRPRWHAFRVSQTTGSAS